jgi:hypothetical protein
VRLLERRVELLALRQEDRRDEDGGREVQQDRGEEPVAAVGEQRALLGEHREEAQDQHRGRARDHDPLEARGDREQVIDLGEVRGPTRPAQDDRPADEAGHEPERRRHVEEEDQ